MKVHEIFRSIQGEGRLAGTPMTFIRLYGCNLSCPWCDSPQDVYTEMSISEITVDREDRWVCITGGEPTIHEELPELINRLQYSGHSVAIETNGIRDIIPHNVDWLCISPKRTKLSGWLCERADEIKLLVGSGLYNAEKELVENLVGWFSKVSLLPIWDDNYEDNLARATELCQAYQVRLTVQQHKYLGIK